MNLFISLKFSMARQSIFVKRFQAKQIMAESIFIEYAI